MLRPVFDWLPSWFCRLNLNESKILYKKRSFEKKVRSKTKIWNFICAFYKYRNLMSRLEHLFNGENPLLDSHCGKRTQNTFYVLYKTKNSHVFHWNCASVFNWEQNQWAFRQWKKERTFLWKIEIIVSPLRFLLSQKFSPNWFSQDHCIYNKKTNAESLQLKMKQKIMVDMRLKLNLLEREIHISTSHSEQIMNSVKCR